MTNLQFIYDKYFPYTNHNETVKQFKLAVATLINNEFITKDEFFNTVGNNFGIMHEAYYNLSAEEKQKLELAGLEVWNKFYLDSYYETNII